MADATADWSAVLATMSDAFTDGDNRRGEDLLIHALDIGAPWDIATSTVAQALSARVAAQGMHSAASPAPA